MNWNLNTDGIYELGLRSGETVTVYVHGTSDEKIRGTTIQTEALRQKGMGDGDKFAHGDTIRVKHDAVDYTKFLGNRTYWEDTEGRGE